MAFAADWKYFFTDTTDSRSFYDTQRISYEQETTKVYMKTVLSEKAKAEAIKESQKHGGPANIENISYSVLEEEINCSKNASRSLSFTWYDSGGGIVYSAI